MNQLKTIVLMGLLSTILIVAGAAIGKGAFYGIIAFTLLMNVVTYYFSDKIVLKMHGGREIGRDDDPHLYGMVEALAGRAKLPMPRVFFIDDPQPNAFATGRNPQNAAVAVTAGLMNILDDREVRGVIAHELAHIKNRDTLVATVVAVIAGVITTVGSILQWGAILGMGRSDDDEDSGGGLGGLLFALIAPIAATLIQLGISRSREFMADKTGAEIADDPEGLARALEKLALGTARIVPAMARPATASLYIANPFSGSGRSVMNLFSTHPAMELRIEKLRALRPGSGWSGNEGFARGGRSVSSPYGR